MPLLGTRTKMTGLVERDPTKVRLEIVHHFLLEASQASAFTVFYLKKGFVGRVMLGSGFEVSWSGLDCTGLPICGWVGV